MRAINIHVNHKRYDKKLVLENIKFTLHKDEIVAVIGPSGAGKSTLLNIIGELDTEFDGELTFEDKEQEKTIGYMFQSSRLMPWLTVTENIRLVTKESNDADIDTLLKNVGLEGHGQMFPLQLSGGMQRRVALARAFVNHPAILLLDEPFVSLDKPTADKLRTQLLELWSDERPAVLYVTHDLREALSIADRILFLSAGPGTIIMNQEINLPRPRTMEDDIVTNMLNDLNKRFPDLLTGAVESSLFSKS